MHREAANAFECSIRHLLSNGMQFLFQLLNRKTVLILTLLFIAGVSGALWNMSRLSTSLIESQALQTAALYAQAIEEARTLYSSEAVNQVATIPGIKVIPDYADTPGAIPVPATFLIELSHHLSNKNPGMSVRLYSDYPFPGREAEGGPKDAFEREALRHLIQYPDQPFYRIETFQGRLALRYAQADIMKASCVSCHNSDKNSPKRDWQVGDVRGALEITRPLDTFMAQTNAGLRGTFLMLTTLSLLALSGIALVIGRLRQTSKELELRVIERTAQLQSTNRELATEQEKSERLLLNILPPSIAQKLKDGQSNIADGFAAATILFADLVNFTQLAEQVPPAELVAMLNEIFSSFDRLTERYGLEKIKTIGDAYMVVGGLPMPQPDHPQAIAEMALAMREEIEKFNLRYHQNCSLRIGINTGPVVAGVIGTKKFIYDLWGDTVNIASRMESHGLPGAIQVTAATYEHLQNDYTFELRGLIQVKGKGEIAAYLLTGRKSQVNSSLTPVAVA